VPQTPFLAKKGRYMDFTKDPQILNVVVQRKLTTSENMYLCLVLDARTKVSGTEIHAQRLIFGSPLLDDIPENTVLHAFRVDNKWWIQSGDESEIPTVDFCADYFDRADLGNLGVYWNDSAIWRVYNEEAWDNDAGGSVPYQTKLSHHNINLTFSFKADIDHLTWWTNFWLGDTQKYGEAKTGAFAVILGWDIDAEVGVYAYGWITIKRYSEYAPLYQKHESYIVTPLGSFKIVDSEVIITSVSQLTTYDTLLLNINENIFTMTGNLTPFSATQDMGAVYQTSVGMRGYHGYIAAYLIQDNFKAWVASIPEPPNESGHGRYIDGEYVYSDKYHVGGEYNPNA
jgi:hypothetical protein